MRCGAVLRAVPRPRRFGRAGAERGWQCCGVAVLWGGSARGQRDSVRRRSVSSGVLCVSEASVRCGAAPKMPRIRAAVQLELLAMLLVTALQVQLLRELWRRQPWCCVALLFQAWKRSLSVSLVFS